MQYLIMFYLSMIRITMSDTSPRWLSAFYSFYNPDEHNIANLGYMSKVLFSMRSVILVISFQAAVIAVLLSYIAGVFNPIYSLILIAGLVLAHAASNLTNDYFGYVRNYDTPKSPRRRYTIHPIAGGFLSKLQVKGLIASFIAVDVLIGLFFIDVRGLGVLAFMVAGAALMIAYDATPITLKQIGLGEIASFLVWGPLMITGGFYALTGQLSVVAFLISIPYGLGVMSILLGKHIDQLEFDRSTGQKTLPVILGVKKARILNSILIALMYALVPLFVLLNVISVFALLVFLNLPRAIKAIRIFLGTRPKVPPKGYAGWPLWYHKYSLLNNRNFGWLYISGLLIGILSYLAFGYPVL
jgi:1,4-dihydroxy-2-naphthoate octaprenyltransferase